MLKILFGLGAFTAITSALSLLYSVLAARQLGPEEFAKLGAAIAFLSIVYGVLGPLHNLTVRFIARERVLGIHGKLRSGFIQLNRVSWGLSTAIALLVMLAFPLAEKAMPLLSTSAWILIAASILFNTPLTVTRGLLRGIQHYNSLGTNQVFEATIRLFTGLLLFWIIASTAEMGMLAYLFGTLAAATLGYFQQRSLRNEDESVSVQAGELWEGFLPILLLSGTTAGLQNGIGLVALGALSAAETGVFFVALTIARLVFILLQPFAMHTLPAITELHTRGGRFGRKLGGLATLFIAVTGPLLLACILIPELIVVFIFSSQYADAAALLFPLCLAFLFIALCHLIALAAVASRQMGPIWIYTSGFIFLMLVFSYWHDSALLLAQILLGVACGLFFLMVVAFTLSRGEQTDSLDGIIDTSSP
jgi:O-antigen/teichoic acid export membrane protein